MAKMSRTKGKVGEREVADLFRQHGVDARRGQQYNGVEGQDVIVDLPGVHVEVKRVEAFRLYPSFEQAKRDGAGKNPVVFHRMSKKPWVAVMDANLAIELLKLLSAKLEVEIG